MSRKTDTPKCIHRHTIDSHPRCFAEGKILHVENSLMEKKLRQELTPVKAYKYKRINVGATPWYLEDGVKMGYFDIETSNFTANNGHMVSWAIKERGVDTIHYDEITQKEILSGDFDKRIVRSLLKCMKDFRIIVGYYSTRFDIPFVRTRAEYWYSRLRTERKKELEAETVTTLKGMLQELLPEDRRVPSRMKKEEIIEALLDRDEEIEEYQFPLFGEIYHFDLYYTVRNKFKFHRNSLGIATQFFGIEGKTHLTTEEWQLVRIADPEVMQTLRLHNEEDVIILEKLHERINPYRKWTRKSM